MTPHIDDEQRRARLAWRHGLLTPTADPAGAVVALHATDPATVHLSAVVRGVPALGGALYEDRSLLRMLGMRRTVFVVPTGFAPVVQAAASVAIAATQRKLLLRHLAECGAGDAAWLADVEASVHAALTARGSATAAQLAADEPRLRTELRFPQGSQYLTSRLLFLLAADGHIVRGRPNGTWLSSQYTWHTTGDWLGAPLPVLDPAAARAALAEAWLARYGPGTVEDLKWWTGWTLTQTRAALSTVDAVPVTLDSGTGFVLPGDTGPVPDPGPWVALLPALDPTVMGWTGRGFYLGPHAPHIFDRTGNPGPTIWSGGRIVGGWAQDATGRIVTEFLVPVAAPVRAAVAAAAGRLGEWLGPVRVTPRFRSPLERRLAEGVVPSG